VVLVLLGSLGVFTAGALAICVYCRSHRALVCFGGTILSLVAAWAVHLFVLFGHDEEEGYDPGDALNGSLLVAFPLLVVGLTLLIGGLVRWNLAQNSVQE
jgi:hypothetical protein